MTTVTYIKTPEYPDESGYYCWVIDKEEQSRLTHPLGTDFHSFNLAAHIVDTPKWEHTCCGKVTGLDDFVTTALRGGIHSREFIIASLKSDLNDGGGHPHRLSCSVCACDSSPDPEPSPEPVARWSKSNKWKQSPDELAQILKARCVPYSCYPS